VIPDPLLEDGAVVQGLVRTTRRVFKNGLRQLDLGEPTVKVIDLLSGLITPVVCERALRCEYGTDLTQCEAGQLEQVDQGNLLYGGRSVDPHASSASDRLEELLALVEAQR